MDMKIKKEQDSNRNLDVPNFKSSEEINKEYFDPTVTLIDTGDLERHEDELKFTTQFITTEFNTDNFEEFAVNTVDLAKDIESIEKDYDITPKPEEQTIDLEREQSVEIEVPIDTDEIKYERQFALSKKYMPIVLVVVIISMILGVKLYKDVTRESRFIATALENPFKVSDINIYGESVNLITDEKFSIVYLYEVDTEEQVDLETGIGIDSQLHLNNVADGEYYLYVDGQIVTVDNFEPIEFQTITREEQNKNISFKTKDSILKINIDTVTKPQVDILIDASQGAVQGFTASDGETTEQQLSLEYALKVQEYLEEMGYNVKLTRTGDEVPGGCSYKDVYCDDGRVAMAYIDNPKIYIQIGFNGEAGSGFEITDSTLNSHMLSRILKSALSSNLKPSERGSGQLEPGIFINTYDGPNNTKIDYLYSIRETGGAIMGSDNESAAKFNSQKVGAQSVRIDLGYISEANDYKKLDEEQEVDAIAKSIASGVDQYINKH